MSVHAWCRVHWLVPGRCPGPRNPALCNPGDLCQPTPLVQGVVSLLHPLLPSPPPHPRPAFFPPAHTVLRSKPCALQAAWPSLPVLPPPGPARAGWLRPAAMVPTQPLVTSVAEGQQPTGSASSRGCQFPRRTLQRIVSFSGHMT